MDEDQMLGRAHEDMNALANEIKDLVRRNEEHELRNQALRAHLDEQAAELELQEEQIEELQNALDGVLDALEDVVNQACWVNSETILDSMALSAYAHGLRELAKHNKVKIHQQVGRRVIASWIPQEEKK